MAFLNKTMFQNNNNKITLVQNNHNVNKKNLVENNNNISLVENLKTIFI
jgi:hypothetical protein